MGSTSRYDRHRRPAASEELEEARALHLVAELLRDSHGVVHRDLIGVLANVLDSTGIELSNGREVTRPVRIAIRRLAYSVQRHMRAGRGEQQHE